jgi:AbrB family looped-hinge helix DNA binding protein
MTTLVKIHRKGQMTLPSRLRAAIGLADGDLVEATVLRGKIVLTPKLVIDRSGFPTANDEYTPAQRRIIDARLAKADEDIKHGRTVGPFNTADEMIAHMKGELKKRAALRKAKRPR